MTNDFGDDSGEKLVDWMIRIGPGCSERRRWWRAASDWLTAFKRARGDCENISGGEIESSPDAPEWAKLDMSEFTALPEYETIRQIIDEKLSREGIRHEFAPMPEGEHLVFMVEDAPAVNDAFKDLEKATTGLCPACGKRALEDARARQGRAYSREGRACQGGVLSSRGSQGQGTRYLARRRDEGEMRPLSQAIAVSAASIACFCAGDALASAASASGFPRCDALVLLSEMLETGLTSEPMALAVGLMAACVPWAVWARRLVRAGTYRQGEEHGSARWGTLKEGRAFMDGKDPANNILLSRDFALALKPKRFDLKHDRNRNVCVLGGPGSGKTRYYVKPNIMQKNADFFVTDPKGTLLGEVGWTLADAGYDIRTFDTTDFSRSMHYNPLKYVKTDTDILSFVNCYIMNTNGDGKAGDPFWENSEKMLYTSLIALLRDWFPPEDYNLSNLLTLLSMAEARENDENFKSPLDLLFLQIEEGKRYIPSEGGAPAPSMGVSGLSRSFGTGNATGDSDWSWEPTNLKRNSDGVRPADCGGLSPDEDFALMNYKNFKVAAGKTLKSIIISCNVRLAPIATAGVRSPARIR